MNKQVPLNDGLVTNGKILYAGTGRTLSAFQAKSGKLIWKNKDWDTAHGTVSTFSVQDSVIIGHAFWEATYANDANTGQKLWSKKIGFGSPVAIYNGFAYYISNTDNSISIVEAKTGKRIVRKSFDFALHNLSVPLVTDKEIIFGTAEEGVIAVDRETLEEKWRFRTGRAMIYTVPTLGDPASPVECSPVLAGDVVYIGASDDDMKLLIAKGYIIPFESGVIVITHWNVSNKVQKDRYKETICIAEKKRIHLNENKAYELISDNANQLESNLDTSCNQSVSNLYTQYRLGEYRTDEESKGKGNKEKEPLKRESYVSIIESYTSNFELQDSIKGYVEMRQKMKGFTVRALKMGLNKLDEIAGDDETKIAIVNQSIERSWKSFYPLSDSSKKEQDRFAGFAF